MSPGKRKIRRTSKNWKNRLKTRDILTMNARYRARRRFHAKRVAIHVADTLGGLHEGDDDIVLSGDGQTIDSINRNPSHNTSTSPQSALIPSMASPFSTVQCGVCLEDVLFLYTVKCPGGGHVICRADIQRLFDRVVDGNDLWPPKCCSSSLSITVCAFFLKPETVEKVHQLLKAKTEAAAKEENDAEDQSFVHQSILKGILQLCPGCRARIHRTGGCTHMTCKICTTEFCYTCGEFYNRCTCEPPPPPPQPPLVVPTLAREPDEPIDLRPHRRIIITNPPQDPAWVILNSNLGRQHGYDRNPEDCRHEARLQLRLNPGVNTNCCALDTMQLQCRLCGYHHCRTCHYQPTLPGVGVDIDVAADNSVDVNADVATTD